MHGQSWEKMWATQVNASYNIRAQFNPSFFLLFGCMGFIPTLIFRLKRDSKIFISSNTILIKMPNPKIPTLENIYL